MCSSEAFMGKENVHKTQNYKPCKLTLSLQMIMPLKAARRVMLFNFLEIRIFHVSGVTIKMITVFFIVLLLCHISVEKLFRDGITFFAK